LFFIKKYIPEKINLNGIKMEIKKYKILFLVSCLLFIISFNFIYSQQAQSDNWSNYSSSKTILNITAKNESRLYNTSVGLDNSYVNLHGRTGSTVTIDDVRLRHYTFPEPTYSIKTEESY
jgi:hypothetical protein